MLVTIFIASALVSGGIFGFYVFKMYDNDRYRRTQKSFIESVPTHMLEAELEKREINKKSAYR